MKEQLHHILEKLVVKNNIRLHQEELKLQLMSHPSYPSLHSVTGVLDHFRINNLALKVPTTEDVLLQLPRTFMANIAIAHEDEVVLVEKKKDHFKITVDAKEHLTLSKSEFLEQWNGVIIAIEKDTNVEEYQGRKYHNLIWIFFGIIGLATTIGFIATYNAIFPIGHFMLSILGLVLSVFIVNHEFGIQTNATQKFCNLSPNTSCDAIIQSNGAKILGLFKLSDISIVAFAGYIIAWLSCWGTGIEHYTTFMAFSALAMPFALFSVYYQYSVVKKWCPLCLGVVCVLTLQFTTFLIGGTSVSSISFYTEEIITVLSGFAIAYLLWKFVKAYLTKKTKLEKLQIEHVKFKRNYSIFEALLKKGKPVEITENLQGEIILGNDNAPIKLMLVTSPYCIYCKDVHTDIHKLLENKNINVTIRFLVGSEDKENDFYKIVSELFHTYNVKGKAATLLLLDKLYQEGLDLSQWVSNRNIHYNPGYDKIMDWQLQWCTDNGIGFTPALYLLNYPFPDDYDRKDLLLFTDEIIENLSHRAVTKVESRLVS